MLQNCTSKYYLVTWQLYHPPLPHLPYHISCYPCSNVHIYTHTPHKRHTCTSLQNLMYPQTPSHPHILTLTPSHTHPHRGHMSATRSHCTWPDCSSGTALLLWHHGEVPLPATDWWAPVDVPARLMEHGAAVSQPANFSRHHVCTCLYAALP